MKCICGYEHVTGWRLEQILQENPYFKNGDEPFKTSAHSIRMQIGDAHYYTDGVGDRTLYACPKCGTVKIDI